MDKGILFLQVGPHETFPVGRLYDGPEPPSWHAQNRQHAAWMTMDTFMEPGPQWWQGMGARLIISPRVLLEVTEKENLEEVDLRIIPFLWYRGDGLEHPLAPPAWLTVLFASLTFSDSLNTPRVHYHGQADWTGTAAQPLHDLIQRWDEMTATAKRR